MNMRMAATRALPVVLAVLGAWASSAPGQQKNLPPEWATPAQPKIVLWAAPGQLHVDPMTGKPFNPFVKDCDWAKASSVWSAADRTLHLAGARNEWLDAQLIVQAEGEDLRNVNVKVGDLVGQGGKVPAASVKLFRVWYTEVTEPSRTFTGGFNALGVPSLGVGWYGDALIPFGVRYWSAPFAVPKGRNQSVWIDLLVPKATPPGRYLGKITVTADRAAAAEVNVNLTVWDFDIPDKLNARAEGPLYRATIPGAFGGGERDEKNLKLERDFYRLCRAHRMIAYVYDTYPDVKGSGKDITVDWEFHDKRFGAYLDGSGFDDKLPIEHWNVPVDTYWPSPRDAADSQPEPYYAALEAVIRQYDEHFKQKNWNPLMYVFFQGLDEPSREDQFVKLRKVAEAVHRGSKRVKFRHDFYTAFAEPGPLIKRFEDVMDIWNISGCFYPVQVLQEQQKKGKEAWFYQGAEPWIGAEDLDNDLLGLRTWAWIAWKYRVDAWHNWCSGRWSSENIFVYANNGGSRQYWRPNSNGVMIYPGSVFGVEELFPSMRLKAYRRGNTEYEYFFLLKQLGAGDKADAIVNSIIHKALGEAGTDRWLIGTFGDWSHDPDAWDKARAELAKAIVQAQTAQKP